MFAVHGALVLYLRSGTKHMQQDIADDKAQNIEPYKTHKSVYIKKNVYRIQRFDSLLSLENKVVVPN